ncbi:hypothetical protein CNBE3260 [Cryptococcus deneoformans B-3501A]|uniref:Transcriptional activator, putative n=1 Tax=Cryptococcus deneoformans (strain JEC21 / ATCC MYA-565) TaxID=214684 RepID=Q5KGK8_CRYD1|nr:transcriptional activator, putative [Cryptococcus neoformans var. neoformans JEC21]XP_775265.1 hypothetical protein CNBE3260 [Cryptococcus neoformans var. neoformans B-3501A]AAW43577.2 transcriptional activator, putative [Cryptococcus neoformans var. neoformans JEC21]EAL20618.1 hypothetical protein CNBE3260 [Cryptococcus neoformans var. neoformans B-3501A]
MSEHTNLKSLAPLGNQPEPSANSAGVGPSKPFTEAQVEEFREQDRWLPIANVARIMKSSLPTSAKVSKEAKECVQECVSEFISFITSEAAEKCLNEKRKTLNGEDILTSMRALGFDNYEGVLRVYLAKYRDSHHSIPKRNAQHEDDDEEVQDGRKKRGRGRQPAGGTISTNGHAEGTKSKRKRSDDGKGVR